MSEGVQFPDGGVIGVVAPDGACSIFLDGWMADVDGGYFTPDEAAWVLDESALALVCEALATGEKQTRDTPRFICSLAEEPSAPNDEPPGRHWVWFFPMTEDWFAFRMRFDELAWGLVSALRWMSQRAPASRRALIERCLVLLDRALARVGS